MPSSHGGNENITKPQFSLHLSQSWINTCLISDYFIEGLGMDLCVEFIWVKVVILIDRQPLCDCRLNWWIWFTMLWSFGMNCNSTAPLVVKLSLVFSGMRLHWALKGQPPCERRQAVCYYLLINLLITLQNCFQEIAGACVFMDIKT